MIYLITGVPGAGKTAYTVWMVKNLSEEQNRDVFYVGVPNLRLPWSSLSEGVTVFGSWERDVEGRSHWLPSSDPSSVRGVEEWYKLPPNSIILIDECQDYFRPRGRSSAVPFYISELEKHRHRGHDIFLITQKPNLVDSNIVSLVGKHTHIFRQFGGRKVRLFTWESGKSSLTKNDLAIAHQTRFSYPKEVFDYYKSTEVDTHKDSRPWFVKFFWVLPVLLVFLVFLSVLVVGSWSKPKQQTSSVSLAVPKSSDFSSSRSSSPVHVLTPAEYVAQWQPRVKDLPYSSPAYDPATKVVNAPLPVACVASKSRCQCYSQQSTHLDVSEQSCRRFVERGFFDPFTNKVSPNEPVPVQQNDAFKPVSAASAFVTQ
jgi:hypothetical protein